MIRCFHSWRRSIEVNWQWNSGSVISMQAFLLIVIQNESFFCVWVCTFSLRQCGYSNVTVASFHSQRTCWFGELTLILCFFTQTIDKLDMLSYPYILDQFFVYMSNKNNLSNGRPPWSSTVKVKQVKIETLKECTFAAQWRSARNKRRVLYTTERSGR